MYDYLKMEEEAVKNIFTAYKKQSIAEKKEQLSTCRCFSCGQNFSPAFHYVMRTFTGNTSDPDGNTFLGWYITLCSVCPTCQKVNKHYKWTYDHPVLMRMAALVDKGMTETKKAFIELYRFSPFFK